MRRSLIAALLAGLAFSSYFGVQARAEDGVQAFDFWGQSEPTPVEPPRGEGSGDIAVLHGFDKITARVTELRLPLNQPVRFGALDIVARYCGKRPPEEPPEVTAFLEIDDVQVGEDPRRIFNGWMFASSPSLSALEHPVYDVWVINCITLAPETSTGKE